MEKIDTSVEEEAVKDEARQFMSDLLPTGEPETVATPAGSTADGAEIVKAWKSAYTADGKKDDPSALMNKFWSIYDPQATSIWTMTYDEADSNENLDETIDIAANLVNQSGMASIQDDCFGVVHTLESLEIEGVWFFNGPDPEKLFGANEESSWYNWSQLGPEATDLVKEAVARIMMPTDGKLLSKTIKDTKVFC